MLIAFSLSRITLVLETMVLNWIWYVAVLFVMQTSFLIALWTFGMHCFTTLFRFLVLPVSKDIYLGSILHSFALCNYLIFVCSCVFNLCDLGAHVGADALCLCVHNTQYSFFVITFRVSRRPAREMYCGHARLCVCLCVCPRPHAHTIARTRM